MRGKESSAAPLLLEETEHRRLVEKWISEDLSDDELARLPDEWKQRTRAYFQSLVDEALGDVKNGRVVDGSSALARMRKDLLARHE